VVDLVLMLRLDFTFTKRHLGYAALLGGIFAIVGVLLYDQLGLSDPEGGFGPSQQLALVGAAISILVGLTLLPLGDTPA
jgi:hypothetical protein